MIKQQQLESLRALHKSVISHVPLYQKLHASGKIPNRIESMKDLQKLPIITKKMIRKNHSEFLSLKKRMIARGQTSGTTGTPFRFHHDIPKLCNIQAHLLLGQSWAGYQLGSPMARLGHQYSPRGIHELLYSLYSRYLKNQITFPYTILTPRIIEKYLYILRRKNITYLEGYVSPLIELAKYVEKSGTEPKLTSVLTKGEMLYPNTRRFIERNLQCSVFESYGSGELGAMAFECSKKIGLHVFDESYIIESIRDGESVVNEVGDLAITDLTNYTQPFIRYLVGDRGVISDEKCECGRESNILKSIEGRANDAITTSNGTWLSSGYFWYLLEPFSNILQWQVEQVSKYEIIFRLVMRSLESKLETSIIEAIERIDHTMRIKFDYAGEIPKTKRGKLRNVISRIRPQTAI